MESLSETKWDVVISGTGIQNSLVALALSRSGKKVLHVDENQYYGGDEAAFSLQEVEEWVERLSKAPTKPFRNASLWKKESAEDDEKKLSFSRAYTLALSPQIIYTKSKLLSQLVSSTMYRQLEFQAVGTWWILEAADGSSLKRLPNGREDIFEDKSIDNRAKRGLMKFLKFVVDYENQAEVWESHAEEGLSEFLSSTFQLPSSLQVVISALTLSLLAPKDTTVRWALPRIARHLTSIGVFGPGFGAVLPKWGGNAEIAQVACRAGAVGGGVYVLGTGVKSIDSRVQEAERFEEVHLSNGETITTRHIVSNTDSEAVEEPYTVSKIIAVISSPLLSLFQSSVEGSAPAAVSVVALPSGTLTVEEDIQSRPVYIMAHSGETGECPNGQCVLYATTLVSANSRSTLEAALTTFLKAAESSEADILYKLYYEQEQHVRVVAGSRVAVFGGSVDLAFDDTMLEDVEREWRSIMGSDAENLAFMKFGDREDHDDEDDVY